MDLANIEEGDGFQRAKEVLKIFKKEELKKEILKLNSPILIKQTRILLNKKNKEQIIGNNLKAAEKVYEISKVTKRFLELVKLK